MKNEAFAPTPELLAKMDAWWRAANYLSACQLYLLDDPLLRRRLTERDIKKKIRKSAGGYNIDLEKPSTNPPAKYNIDLEKIDSSNARKNPAVNTYVYIDPDADDNGQEYKLKKRVTSRAEAERLAKATLRKLNLRKLTGSMTLDTRLVAGVVVEVRGFGSFDGRFFVESATHSVSGSGYTTSINVRRVNNKY